MGEIDRGGRPQEPSQSREPYYLASRFGDEEPAARAYFRVQKLIFKADCDLSSYRFQLSLVWHVAVLGRQPSGALDATLRRILATGEPVSLPADILHLLEERRARAKQIGPWVERHYDPGKLL